MPDVQRIDSESKKIIEYPSKLFTDIRNHEGLDCGITKQPDFVNHHNQEFDVRVHPVTHARIDIRDLTPNPHSIAEDYIADPHESLIIKEPLGTQQELEAQVAGLVSKETPFESKKHKDWEMGNSSLIDSKKEGHWTGGKELSNSNQGLRYNEGKLDYTLMDLEAFKPMIQVLEFGAKKYSRDNWKKGGKLFTLLSITGSLMRHLVAYLSGQDNDPESGLSHVGHMQCNLMFLGYFAQQHNKLKKQKQKSTFDDRFKEKN